MANQMRKNTALIAFLAQMTSGEWFPRKALGMTDYHPGYIPRLLTKMQEERYIDCKGGHKDVRCRIARKGRECLTEINPIRYGELIKEDQKRIRSEEDDVYRQVCRSTLSIMSQLAGYGVHPHDKPDLCVASARNITSADRPAFIAQAASGIVIPHDEGLNSIYNYTDYRYFFEDTLAAKEKWLDTGIYRTRKTPIGCVYTRTEILNLTRKELSVQENGKGNIQNLSGSSIAGILFSGNGAYKLYMTGNTAPKMKPGFDLTMTNNVKVWAGKVYMRSLEPIQESVRKQHLCGSILIGDGSYRAAVHVITNTQDKQLGKRRNRQRNDTYSKDGKKKERGDLFNLIDVPVTYYIPAIREALPAYSALIYPKFEMALRGAFFVFAGLTGITGYERLDPPTCFDAISSDGREIACMFPLNLDRMLDIQRSITSNTVGVVIYCPIYEVKFYDLLLQTLKAEIAGLFEIIPIPQDFIEYFIGELQEYFGYDGPFPIIPDNLWAMAALKNAE